MLPTTHMEIDSERKLIADFIRLAHCLMSTQKIAESVENGTYLEIMDQKRQDEFIEEGLGCKHEH